MYKSIQWISYAQAIPQLKKTSKINARILQASYFCKDQYQKWINSLSLEEFERNYKWVIHVDRYVFCHIASLVRNELIQIMATNHYLLRSLMQ